MLNSDSFNFVKFWSGQAQMDIFKYNGAITISENLGDMKEENYSYEYEYYFKVNVVLVNLDPEAIGTFTVTSHPIVLKVE